MPIKVLLADDDQMYRDALEKAVKELAETVDFEICGIACNGEELVKFAENSRGINWVFTDMRMPVADGLTALVKLKKMSSLVRVVICSSESKTKLAGLRTKNALPFEEGIVLLDKIATRVKAGKVEAGKINTILEGCEKLGLDPFRVAQHYGASGYAQKPITAEKIKTIMDALEGGQSFVHVGITGSVES